MATVVSNLKYCDLSSTVLNPTVKNKNENMNTLVMHKITTCIYYNVNTSEMLHLSISVTCVIVIPPYC
jgi:hypothetical protein